MVTCSKCGKIANASLFRPSRSVTGIGTRPRQCLVCYFKHRHALYAKYDKQRNAARSLRWRTDAEYRRRNKLAAELYRKTHAAVLRIRQKAQRVAIRAHVLSIYGGQCECCKERQPEFLAIDHVAGNGAVERRRIGSWGVYIKLHRAGRRLPGYRILCHNCNMAIGFYGYCPHQQIKGTYGSTGA
jgi:hypothetical protein